MATLSELARARRSQLKSLMLASRKLDAAQEKLEREVKRLINRKKSVPEASDAQRLIQMARDVNAELNNMSQLLGALSNSWSSV